MPFVVPPEGGRFIHSTRQCEIGGKKGSCIFRAVLAAWVGMERMNALTWGFHTSEGGALAAERCPHLPPHGRDVSVVNQLQREGEHHRDEDRPYKPRSSGNDHP